MTKPTREKRITSLKRVVAVQTEFPVTNLREALEIISEQAAEIAELRAENEDLRSEMKRIY